MNIVDIFIILILFFSFWRGWSKGLLKAVFGPIAVVICLLYGYVYYQKTNNLVVSAVIIILGPLVLNIIVSILIAMFRKSRKEDQREPLTSIVNRLFGAMLNVGWVGGITCVAIFLFLMIPIRIKSLENVRIRLVESQSVSIMAFFLGDRYSFLKGDVEPVDLETAQENFKYLQNTKEFTHLMDDERVKEMFRNPETAEKIKNQDIAGLLQDPLVKEIMQDPDLIQQFFAVNRKMMEINYQENNGGKDGDNIQ